MGKINDYVLNLMGFNTAPSPYTKSDWSGKATESRVYANMMGDSPDGMSDIQARALEKKKSLPKSVQLRLLNRKVK